MVRTVIISSDAVLVLSLALALLTTTCCASSLDSSTQGGAGASTASFSGESPTLTTHLESAYSFIQSGSSMKSGVVGRLDTVLPFDDIYDGRDEPENLRLTKSEDQDPSFYFSLCLDMLIILVVAHGVKRFRDGDHLTAVDPAADKRLQACAAKPRQHVAKASPSVPELHAAVRAGDISSCVSLLDKGSCSAILAGEDTWGCTALHIAADGGSAAKVELLLKRRASVDARDTWDQTPLHFAARSGSSAICDLLLSRGAAINAIDADDRTPLHTAALLGHESVCELLLERGGCLENVADADVPPVLTSLLIQRMLRGLPSPTDESRNS